jgi:single-stranded DNA-binding protein
MLNLKRVVLCGHLTRDSEIFYAKSSAMAIGKLNQSTRATVVFVK